MKVRDLSESVRFYETLLGTPGRQVAQGRIYFDVGSVILGLLDDSKTEPSRRSMPAEALYIATSDLDRVHERARGLRCLSTENLHDDPTQPMGSIAVRPWGERSFYLQDPTGNPLCFVDAATVFSGTPEQVAEFNRPSGKP